MHEAKTETVGLRSGSGCSRAPKRIECVPAAVPHKSHRSYASLQKEEARARRQTRTGKRQNRAGHDDQILTGKPLVIRWFVYVFAALFMCGIIPMAIAGGLITFCETYNCEWLIFVLCGAVIWLIFRIIERDI
ncbi:hypothetical protein AAAX75_07965 [Collinsella sp. CLA-ER-H7]|uniref:hypothetical protein n=1 Tax=Collinsella sp. CLA-ER-H7 TaxID=3136230 RepID=UPI0032C169FA